MNNLTDLNLFQKAVLAAIDKTAEQGQQSKNEDGCAYRGTSLEGAPLCCTVGHMVKDEQYHEGLENSTISDIRVIRAVELSLSASFVLNVDEITLLTCIQGAHDHLDTKDWALGFYNMTNAKVRALVLSCSVSTALVKPILDHCLAKIETLSNRKIK